MKLYKVRDFNQTLNETFGFIRENIAKLSLALASVTGVFVIATVIANSYFHQLLFNAETDSSLVISGGLTAIFAIVLSSLIIAVVSQYLKLYFEKGKEKITIPEISRASFASLGNILVTTVAYYVIVFLGFICFIVPGIYLSVVFPILYAVRTHENLGLWDSITKSHRLMQGHWWRSFGLYLVMTITLWIIVLITALPAALILGFQAMLGQQGLLIEIISVLLEIVKIMATTFVSSFFIVMIYLHYGSLRELYEAPGLNAAIDDIGNNNTSKANTYSKNDDNKDEEYY